MVLRPHVWVGAGPLTPSIIDPAHKYWENCSLSMPSDVDSISDDGKHPMVHSDMTFFTSYLERSKLVVQMNIIPPSMTGMKGTCCYLHKVDHKQLGVEESCCTIIIIYMLIWPQVLGNIAIVPALINVCYHLKLRKS